MAAPSLGQARPRRAIERSHSALVVTIVHNPEDSRISQRQLTALIEAGWDVTYAAPFGAFGLDIQQSPPAVGRGSLRRINLPRARGRRRYRAWRAARMIMRSLAQDHEVVLVHDPDLLLAAAGLGVRNLVWDVHEDPAAALEVKYWMPAPLRRPVAAAWRRAERVVERRHYLLLAEYAYQQRFRQRHPVVPNSVRVPKVITPAGDERVSYLGTVTMARGCDTMIEVGRELRRRTGGAVKLEVIGEAPDPEARQALQSATEAGSLSWLGFMRSDEALARVSGSLAGLCLLRDLPNHRVSLSTKIVEYSALGVPVITTPLPLHADLVRSENVGIEVPWNDPSAVVDAILRLRAEPELRRQLGANGHAVALRQYDWNHLSADFVRVMGAIADGLRDQAQPRRERVLPTRNQPSVAMPNAADIPPMPMRMVQLSEDGPVLSDDGPVIEGVSKGI
jgi:glycosyltransferase involved in cell wall biosynthesis